MGLRKILGKLNPKTAVARLIGKRLAKKMDLKEEEKMTNEEKKPWYKSKGKLGLCFGYYH